MVRTPSISDSELLTAVATALAAADEPITAAVLRKGLGEIRVPEKRLAELLEREAQAGRLHSYCPVRGKA